MLRWIKNQSNLLPLIAMLGIGGGWWFVESDLRDEHNDTIEVTTEDLEYATSDFEAATGREPTAQERQQLLDRHIDDEILIREGILASPWSSDPVIRRRLVQLVSFFDIRDGSEDPASLARQALLRRAEHYDVQIGDAGFDLRQSLSEAVE